MGPNYRIAILINGEWVWLEIHGKVYVACSSESAAKMATVYEGKYKTRIISAFGSDHKLPENPKYTAIIYENGEAYVSVALTHEQANKVQEFIGSILGK